MNPDTRPPLFLSTDLDIHAGEIVLEGGEANHAARSRRLGVGDSVHLTDGRGLLAVGAVTDISRSPLTLTIALRHVVNTPEPATRVILASALPKGDRLYTLLDMATQLGMQAFQPLACRRSVVRWQPRMEQRCRRVLESASKQCRQPRIPDVLPPLGVSALVARADGQTHLVTGTPNGGSLYQSAECIIDAAEKKIVILVGPEGGFDRDEEEILAACPNYLPVRCGNLILRTETAALALLAAVNQWLAGCGRSSNQPE